MTGPRVSEEDAEHAIRSIDYEHSGERLNYWKSAQEVRRLFRSLLSERAALEAKLAEARKEFAREALDKYGMCMFGVPLTKHHGGPFVNWLRAAAEGEG